LSYARFLAANEVTKIPPSSFFRPVADQSQPQPKSPSLQRMAFRARTTFCPGRVALPGNVGFSLFVI